MFLRDYETWTGITPVCLSDLVQNLRVVLFKVAFDCSKNFSSNGRSSILGLPPPIVQVTLSSAGGGE